jgi:hypothetical protein
MGLAKLPQPVKLFIAVMHAPNFNIEQMFHQLKAQFGDIETTYGPIPFSWSDYYSSEMGEGLFKTYIMFHPLIDRSRLASIKCFTNALESECAADEKRRVNLDPGYLARDKLVLASTKDFYHRLYLSDGIFGEVTLHYRLGCFRHFSWTFPDYREENFIAFIEKARAKLVFDLRH